MCVIELPVCSPLVSSVHKILEQWETDLKDRLEKFDSAPANYIPGVYIEPSFGSSVTIVKYHTIMDPANTPFTWVLICVRAFCLLKLWMLADSQPMLVGLVWGLVATWCSVCMYQMNWVSSHNGYSHVYSTINIIMVLLLGHIGGWWRWALVSPDICKKNCSFCTLLMATDQKPQKIIKWHY